jgi:hypothetical protein
MIVLIVLFFSGLIKFSKTSIGDNRKEPIINENKNDIKRRIDKEDE